MALALRYGFAAFVLVAISLGLRGPALLLLWPALTSAALATAYFTASAGWLGKRSDGSIHPAAVLVFLPYFATVWSALRIRQVFFAGGAWSEVSPTIVVGRRPFSSDLPPGVDLVVDCTAELTELRSVVEKYSYRLIPTLDRSITQDEEFAALLRELTGFPGGIYLHCAAGKGRSAAVASALLCTRGLARDPAEAERAIRAARPQVRLHAAQRRQVERVVAQLTDRQGDRES